MREYVIFRFSIILSEVRTNKNKHESSKSGKVTVLKEFGLTARQEPPTLLQG